MNPALERLLIQFHGQTPIRAGSLIVTLFGDAISVRGGTLSLASISSIMQAFRIGEGLVRTAMSRLVRDGLFERISVGRHSYFRLSEDGAKLFSDAAAKIYSAAPKDWNGILNFALLDGSEKQVLRAELAKKGFAQLTPELLLAVARTYDGPQDGVIFIPSQPHVVDAQRLVAKAWPLAEHSRRYLAFKTQFDPLLHIEAAELPGLDALIGRVLLIHNYRRIVLRDPMLPLPLLPQDWAGVEARRVCGTIYRRFLKASEEWLTIHARNEEGPLPEASEELCLRFSGNEPGGEHVTEKIE